MITTTMIQELNLSPTGYVIVLLILAWGFYQLVKTPSKIEPTVDVREPKNDSEPEYLSRYGRVMQIERWN